VTTEATLRHFAASGPDPRRGYIEFMKRGAKDLDTLPVAPGTAPDAGASEDAVPKK
jgi:hypothetical protein